MRHAKLIICQFVYTYSVLHGIRYQPSICGWHCHLYLSLWAECVPQTKMSLASFGTASQTQATATAINLSLTLLQLLCSCTRLCGDIIHTTPTKPTTQFLEHTRPASVNSGKSTSVTTRPWLLVVVTRFFETLTYCAVVINLIAPRRTMTRTMLIPTTNFLRIGNTVRV